MNVYYARDNMKKIAVLVAGSSGIQSTCHLLTWLKGWEVTNINDPLTPIIGIGESTNPSFVASLELGMDLNLYDIFKNKDLDATIKHGTLYVDWRDSEFINPLLGSGVAIHMNTFKLKEYAFPKIASKWKDKFIELNGNISGLTNKETCAVVIVDGKEYEFDCVVDCRGFPPSYDDDYIIVNNPTNNCLVHNVMEGADWGATKHVATQDGWMFALPFINRQSYGYLFNNTITDVEEAKRNFSKKIDVPVEEMDNIEYKFKSYYCKNLIDGRIIKNGNRAVFFEPMFANSLWLYKQVNTYIVDFLTDSHPAEELNQAFRMRAKEVEEMICFQYHGGSLYESPFWKYVKEYCGEKIKTSTILPVFEQEFKELGKNNYHQQKLFWCYDMQGLLIVDKNFGYNYFNKYYTEHKNAKSD